MSKIKAFGEGDWVSAKTKELDKLGGATDCPGKSHKSTHLLSLLYSPSNYAQARTDHLSNVAIP